MNWYTLYKMSAMTKLASMDVRVDGFTYPRKWDNVLEMSFGLLHPCLESAINSMTPEEKDFFSVMRAPEVITPDGDSHFEKTGILNFYVDGISNAKQVEIIRCIKATLAQQGIVVGKWWPESYGQEKYKQLMDWVNNYSKENPTDQKWLKRMEFAKKMSPESRRVVRIQITQNNNDSTKQDLPPDINMANANAIFVFKEVLKMPNMAEDGGGPFDVADLIRRITYYMGEKQLPEREGYDVRQYAPQQGEEWKTQQNDLALFGPTSTRPNEEYEQEQQDPANQNTGQWGARHIDGGYDQQMVRTRLQQVLSICQWALSHGFKTISVF